jgi:hypothetical protein
VQVGREGWFRQQKIKRFTNHSHGGSIGIFHVRTETVPNVIIYGTHGKHDFCVFEGAFKDTICFQILTHWSSIMTEQDP